MMPALLCVVAFLLLPHVPAYGADDVERDKIDYLIEAVAGLHDARFIRNGAEYDAAHAADHLRVKLRGAGSRVRTAEDFIRYCATASSLSGEAYKIRFGDGRTVAAAEFLRARLAAYAADAAHPH